MLSQLPLFDLPAVERVEVEVPAYDPEQTNGTLKQIALFGPTGTEDEKYTKKIDAPIYEPSHAKPHLMTLVDTSKTKKLLREIELSHVSEEEKDFLRAAAWRHAVFHYERIADYYAHSTPEMQRFMERSALVIIDFDAAIEQGYVRMCSTIRSQFFEEYPVDATP